MIMYYGKQNENKKISFKTSKRQIKICKSVTFKKVKSEIPIKNE